MGPTTRKPYIMGIDPGLSGAIAVFSPLENKLIDVFDIPIEPSGVGERNQIDVKVLVLKIGAISDKIAFCVIEDVHSTPNDGPVGAFSFGKSFGILIGVVEAHMIPTTFTPSSVWKNCYGLSPNKNESRILAAKKFPQHSELFKRKKDDGRAESALLADFGRRFY